MNILKGFALLIVLLGVTSGALAQDSFDRYCAKIGILQDRQVQNEIGITEAQRKKMNSFADAYKTKMNSYGQKLAGKQPDMKVVQNYMAELTKNVHGVLTGKQIVRLRELNLQAAGLIGLLDPVVAKKIGMTDAQIKKYRDTYAANKAQADKINVATYTPIGKKYEQLAAKYKGKEKENQSSLQQLSEDYKKEMEAARKRIDPQVKKIERQTESSLNALLTAQQRAAWNKLKGKTFTPKTAK